MSIVSDTILARTVETAMREIVGAAHRPEGSYVRTPVLYPSGNGVVVRVSGGPGHDQKDGRYFVSDFGLGYNEAELMGIERSYTRYAKTVGEVAGVGFDEHAFFAVEVAEAQLPGAIVTIANCSVEAVSITAYKAAERVSAESADSLIDKLERTFGVARVKKKPIIVGASNHEWELTASVSPASESGRLTVFEVATKHPNSVASVATKMYDLARLEGAAPRRLVMVHNKAAFGTYLNVLNATASVLEDDIAPEMIRRLAEAA